MELPWGKEGAFLAKLRAAACERKKKRKEKGGKCGSPVCYSIQCDLSLLPSSFCWRATVSRLYLYLDIPRCQSVLSVPLSSAPVLPAQPPCVCPGDPVVPTLAAKDNANALKIKREGASPIPDHFLHISLCYHLHRLMVCQVWGCAAS